ncbi:MAG: ABC transporter permease [Anaerolineae bacterium]|nr:ABC transporter permease [Anaerolineae bacterium]
MRIARALHIVWTVAAKDIGDALRSRLVIGLVLASLVGLSTPRLLPRMFVQTSWPVAVYARGDSALLAALEADPEVSVWRVGSFEELEALIGSPGLGSGPQVGLVIPAGVDEELAAGTLPALDGYLAWANRFKADRLQREAEGRLGQALDRVVAIDLAGHVVYPRPDSAAAGILTITGITIVLAMGLTLVPQLLIEEKQTRTLDALLVSPATAGQVVAGKAVASFFYVLLTAAVLFVFDWTHVVHWAVALLFVVGCGLFGVAVGLVLGSFFENAQEITGWLALAIVLLTGAMLANLLPLDLPAWVGALLPWVPSVALAEVYRLALVAVVPGAQLWTNLGVVAAVSAGLYALVIWRVRREDR